MNSKWVIGTLLSVVTLVLIIHQSVVIGTGDENLNRVQVSNHMPYRGIANQLVYLEDPKHAFAIEDVIRGDYQSLFKSLDESYINLGYSESSYWFKVALENHDQAQLDLVMEIAFPVLDHIEGFLIDRDKPGNTPIHKFSMGDRLPFNVRTLKAPSFIQPLRFNQANADLYLKVTTYSPINLPIYLSSRDRFDEHMITRQWVVGVVYGIAIALMCYNLVLFFTLRDRMYLYYTLFTGSLFMFYACVDGLAFRLWPNSVEWQSKAHIYFVFLSCSFAILFARRFLSINESYPQGDKNTRALVWLNVVGLLSTPFLLEKYAAMVMSLTTGFSLICLFVIGLRRLRDGIPLAGLYVLIYGLLIISAMFNVISSQGFLFDFIEMHTFMKIASVIELILLSIGVGYQITVIQKAQMRAEQHARRMAQDARKAERLALEIQVEANKTLEDNVRERTQQLQLAMEDLNLANAQLKRLSELDPLTGLYNRRKFEESLRELVENNLPSQRGVWFYFIDIDFFKKFNDTYGHDVGDECLKQVARLLRKLASRYSLTVGRLGGEEFAAIASESSFSGADGLTADELGEAIRSEIEKTRLHVNGQDLKITVSIGGHVAIGFAPEQKSELMKLADEALYVAKNRGRNQVVMVGDTDNGQSMLNA